MSFSTPSPSPVTITQASPSAAPTLGATTQGTKPTAKSSQPTYLGSALTATSANTQQKTLLGT